MDSVSCDGQPVVGPADESCLVGAASPGTQYDSGFPARGVVRRAVVTSGAGVSCIHAQR